MSRLRLLLVNVGRRVITPQCSTPPLGILSLAGYVRSKLDVDVCLIDQRAENSLVGETVARALEFAPDVVGLSALTVFSGILTQTIEQLRQALPEVFVVLGGPHASAFGKEVLESTPADVAVVGEGERSLEQILLGYRDRDGLASVPGLIWREESGEVRVNPGVAPVVEDLDTLPFPAYDLLDHERYWHLHRMSPLPFGKYAALSTSRGCPYGCIYCHRIFGKRFRAQSAARIVEEIEHYVRSLRVDEIEFYDDAFNLDPKRVIEFTQLLRQRNITVRINFPNALRTDVLTDDTIDALVAAGTYHSSFALESGSPRIQNLIKKNLDIDKYVENVAKMVGKGVFAHGFTMLGFPTETEEDLQATLDVAYNSRLHTATFFTVLPFPNTELYAWAEKMCPERLAGLRYDLTHYLAVRFNLSAVPDEVLFGFQRRAWRRFYLHPRRAWRIVRDYPKPLFLFRFIPTYLERVLKGLIGQEKSGLE